MADFEPDDAIGDVSMILAEELAQARLEQRPIDAMIRTATETEQQAFESLCTTARVVGQLLRPDGHDGGPIGKERPEIAIRVSQAFRGQASMGDVLADAANACRLVGYAAAGDVDMTFAIARAIVRAPEPLERAHSVLGAMLEILYREPRPDPRSAS